MSRAYEAFLRQYRTYTEIQKVAMPMVESGKHCLIVAPTGAGKTEAAMLPLLNRICDGDTEGIKVLYITPLRALNRDLIKRLEDFCASIGVTISVRHGDTTQSERGRQARKAPMVMVTTPETLQSILPTKTIGVALANVKAVVVDEIHELYHTKRGAQLSMALERLEEKAPGFQRIGISATISDTDSVRRFLCNDVECRLAATGGRKELDVKIEMPTHYESRLRIMKDRFGLDDDALARLGLIARSINLSKSTLVFANTRQVVEALGSRLVYLNGIESFGGIGVHHSSLDKGERISIENDFKSGKIKSMIATSSLELGIDIGNIDLVVQYGSPRQALRLMQRVGRSGHTQKGVSKGLVIPTNAIEAIEAAAVCRQALSGHLENFRMQVGASDVLANQICGIALDKGTVSFADLQRIVGRSYIYSALGSDKLRQLLEFMGKQRMIGFDGATVTCGARTRMYYYDHLSVIPDTKSFAVKNIIENRIISRLDERFVADKVDEGTVFITKGLPWKVLSIDNDVISVEPSMELEAAVPDWTGEDIPISKATAQMVFSLLDKKGEIKEFADAKTSEKIGEFIESQRRCFVPSEGRFVIETLEGYKVLYTGLGTKANEALARLLASTYSAKLGSSINVKASPYLIFIELPRETDIRPVLKALKPESLEGAMRSVVENTELFRYQFVVIAKLFGIIDRDAILSRSLARRLIGMFAGTPVREEALRMLMDNYFDLPAVAGFLEGIQSGRITMEIVQSESASPFAKLVLNSAYYTKELITPLTPNSELVESFAKFVLTKNVKLLCTYCGFSFTRGLEEIKGMEAIKCPSCQSPMLTIYDDSYNEVIKKRRKGIRLKGSEALLLKEALSYASLFSTYGGKAAVALSVYGVGYKTAARTLMMLKHDERSFFMDLLEAQKNFIRTKKYWSV